MSVVLFDLLCCQPTRGGSKFHGGGEYGKTVFYCLSNIIKQKDKNNELIVFYNYDHFLDDWIKKHISDNGIRSYNVKKYDDIKGIFAQEKIDVYYSAMAYIDLTNIIPENVKKIGTIHGLRFVEKPTDVYEYAYRKTFLQSIKAFVKPLFRTYLCNRSLKNYEKEIGCYDEVVCVSNHTYCSISNYFPNQAFNLRVFYTPNKHLIQEQLVEDKAAIINKKYLLLIGCNRWEKNSFRAIMAILDLQSKGLIGDYTIVTVGKLPKAVFKRIKDNKKFIQYDYVEPNILENLYKNCDIFLYPSLNEGFGMPPLEAMKYGKTCIVSGVCSLPEICGDAVYYCNPYDIGEIQNRIIMASINKMDKNVVLNRQRMIQKKQDADLIELCLFIIGKK